MTCPIYCPCATRTSQTDAGDEVHTTFLHPGSRIADATKPTVPRPRSSVGRHRSRCYRALEARIRQRRQKGQPVTSPSTGLELQSGTEGSYSSVSQAATVEFRPDEPVATFPPSMDSILTGAWEKPQLQLVITKQQNTHSSRSQQSSRHCGGGGWQ